MINGEKYHNLLIRRVCFDLIPREVIFFRNKQWNPEFLSSKTVWIDARDSAAHYTYASLKRAPIESAVFSLHPFDLFERDLCLLFLFVLFQLSFLAYNKYKIRWNSRARLSLSFFNWEFLLSVPSPWNILLIFICCWRWGCCCCFFSRSQCVTWVMCAL